MTIDIAQARLIAAAEMDAQGRSAMAGMVRSGLMDDNPAVQHALSAGVALPPSPTIDPGVSVNSPPSFIDMGQVANVYSPEDVPTG